MSDAQPVSAAAAAGKVQRPSRRRRRLGPRLIERSAPYALLAPASLVIAAVLAYPLYLLGSLSFQKYGLFELIRHQGEWVGTANYAEILHDREFWAVLLRTLAFTTAAVSLTMVFGTLIALLLAQLGAFMRLLLSTGLVLVWSMPVLVAVNIWIWMVDYEFGVLNWLLTELHVGDFVQHDWFENPLTGWAVITAIVVWGAIPFVAITVYAGLTQVPQELVEAASLDGASGTRVFRDVTVPLLKPIFIILTSLSVIWDFQVFSQVWITRFYQPSSDYFVIGVYSFVKSFRVSEYGLGSAIAVVMVLIMFIATFFYIRQMTRIGEVR
jgi:N,N'-diacetylchitobiose transport system permease protein